jgi:hypothetical protein
MSTSQPVRTDQVNDPAPHHFVLTVRPGSARQAWRAWLRSENGLELSFDSPIDLLRHLAQLQMPSPPGGLK